MSRTLTCTHKKLAALSRPRVCVCARIGYSSEVTPFEGGHADVAQLVEHHLAKVRVAGSNPVVRSEYSRFRAPG